MWCLIPLPDADKKSFSYYIDVSEDKVYWTRVIDHSKYPCRSLQNFYFKPRPVHYIRICGTAPVNDIFEISKFKALYTTEPLKFDPDTGLHIPVVNRILFDPKLVCKRTYEGPFEEFSDLQNVYSNGVILQLAQPFFFKSLKVTFVDRNVPAHGYNVEVSGDGNDWTRVFSGESNVTFHKVQIRWEYYANGA
uniref:F5/8 type C domain-containing protein n=1 Tax=Panagrellus redivivus TaxID=6233 RepID=A0A7E4W6V1_PANRE